ncbi:MAG: methyltransferase domain-containing protein [Candidatus Rokubacteria bacterium]|nr:methyltransferase domain-containing protein [Candidatus Rokubacteria bacterium]
MFDSQRFFEEAWPKISQGFESEADAESEIQWILGHVQLAAGARVLDAPCGFGRHALALARRGYKVTGVDLSEVELRRAHDRAAAAGLHLDLVCQDMRAMDFSEEFDLALNLFSSIGYFSDEEDRQLLDRFCRALRPGGAFVLDTRNRDHYIRNYAEEETQLVPGGTVRITHRLDLATSRIRSEWRLQEENRFLGETGLRIYSPHELYRMLRPERWSNVEIFGGLDGRPISFDSPRIVLVAWK